jgi:hypothetical protein
MIPEIKLIVHRLSVNIPLGFGENQPNSFDLHERRRLALHAVFDHEPAWRVLDWGETDGRNPREIVELKIEILSIPQSQAVELPSLGFISLVLTGGWENRLPSESIKALIERLRVKQKQRLLLDFLILLPDGAWMEFSPDGLDAEVWLSPIKGQAVSLRYSASSSDLPAY